MIDLKSGFLAAGSPFGRQASGYDVTDVVFTSPWHSERSCR
ncbi:hypothetical protein ACWGJB_36135 [Streptomyces sp. NPDC054813]